MGRLMRTSISALGKKEDPASRLAPSNPLRGGLYRDAGSSPNRPSVLRTKIAISGVFGWHIKFKSFHFYSTTALRGGHLPTQTEPENPNCGGETTRVPLGAPSQEQQHCVSGNCLTRAGKEKCPRHRTPSHEAWCGLLQ